MNAPLRRILIFPIDRVTAEVIVLGVALDVIEIAILVRNVIDAWRGFAKREVIGLDDGCREPIPFGHRVQLGAEAQHSDATAEVLLALRCDRNLKAIRWSGGNAGSDSALGLVGTW